MDTNWKTSSFCESNACVEVALQPADGSADGAVGVMERDEMIYLTGSSDRVPVAFTPDEWAAFKKGIVAGEFSV